MPWTEIAVDGEPPTDMSGGVTLYEVYDGDTVHLTGRFDDTWMATKDGIVTPTHWKLWFGTDAPPTGLGWVPVADFVLPTDARVELIEVYDGATTSLTAWSQNAGGWLYEVPGATDMKYPTLSDPPV